VPRIALDRLCSRVGSLGAGFPSRLDHPSCRRLSHHRPSLQKRRRPGHRAQAVLIPSWPAVAEVRRHRCPPKRVTPCAPPCSCMPSPRRPLQLTVSSTVARRCASGMFKPAPGGQPDPLEACGVEYHVGIVDEQVRCSLRLHTPCKPRHARMRPRSRRPAPLDRSCPCAQDCLHAHRVRGEKAPPCVCFVLSRADCRERACASVHVLSAACVGVRHEPLCARCRRPCV
jgi:hypothetical protein